MPDNGEYTEFEKWDPYAEKLVVAAWAIGRLERGIDQLRVDLDRIARERFRIVNRAGIGFLVAGVLLIVLDVLVLTSRLPDPLRGFATGLGTESLGVGVVLLVLERVLAQTEYARQSLQQLENQYKQLHDDTLAEFYRMAEELQIPTEDEVRKQAEAAGLDHAKHRATVDAWMEKKFAEYDAYIDRKDRGNRS